MEAREDLSNQNLDFPEDILLEIFFKLPIKSLFRFKSVSKKWLSLISDPSFFFHYVSKSKDSLPFALIFHHNYNTQMHLFFSSHPHAFKNMNFQSSSFSQISCLKLEATSNDLILYQTYSSESEYILMNPFTDAFATIPMHSKMKGYGPIGFTSRIANGIARYKIARIKESVDVALHNIHIEIFSSEKGKWESINLENSMNRYVDFDQRPCFEFNGVMHWICNKLTTLLPYDPFGDLDKCRFINIPNGAYYLNGINAILGVSRGNICYFETSGISIDACKFPGWKLWVLEDYEKGEWSLYKYGNERNIESFNVLSSLVLGHSPILPVAFHPWDKDLVYFLYEGYVLTFDVRKEWFEDEFFLLSCESLVSTCIVFPLLMPFHPTEVPRPEGAGKKKFDLMKDEIMSFNRICLCNYIPCI